jgi:hypothetical protein
LTVYLTRRYVFDYVQRIRTSLINLRTYAVCPNRSKVITCKESQSHVRNSAVECSFQISSRCIFRIRPLQLFNAHWPSQLPSLEGNSTSKCHSDFHDAAISLTFNCAARPYLSSIRSGLNIKRRLRQFFVAVGISVLSCYISTILG